MTSEKDDPKSSGADQIPDDADRVGEAAKREQVSSPAPGHLEVDAPQPARSPSGRLSRLASGALSAMSSAGAATDPRSHGVRAVLRKFMVPIGVLAVLLVLFFLFHEILLPFILALVIVYLMEPIVSRIGRTPESPSGLPRWLAVIFVYLVFFGVITATIIGFVPRLVAEVVSFGEAMPAEVQAFRTQELPQLNEKLQAALSEYMPLFDSAEKEVETPENAQARELEVLQAGFVSASLALHSARRKATSQTIAQIEAARLVGLATQVQVEWTLTGEPGFQERTPRFFYTPAVRAELERTPLSVASGGFWSFSQGTEEPAFKIVPARGGGFDFYMRDVDLEFERSGPESWRVRRVLQPPVVARTEAQKGKEEQGFKELLDLERGLDRLIESAAKSSNTKVSSVISFAQEILVGIIQAFVALILTLMVAAFITIDLPGLMAFFRNLIPGEHRERYDELLVKLDRGLGGVVRGQLTICLVNGVLTYVGLLILDIKFSLLLAVVAGVMSLIPIFGTILSSIPIVLIGMTNGIMTGVLALLWILGIHFVEANILNPKIIGTSAHIHPVIIIFALLAGESAFGLVGALLAVPTTSILLTLFKFFVMRTEHGREAFADLEHEHEEATQGL